MIVADLTNVCLSHFVLYEGGNQQTPKRVLVDTSKTNDIPPDMMMAKVKQIIPINSYCIGVIVK